jgi:3-oxoadipate enol-lactonase
MAGRLRYLEAPSRRTAGRPGPDPEGTLVLIHAFPLNARMWEPQLVLADAGWRVIAPQLRGFDGGVADPPVQSLDDYAGDIVDLLDALHVDQAVIAGLSMGGYVAFALFRLAPRYFRGLVLADTRPEADSPDALDGRRRMLAVVADQGASAVADAMIPRLLGETTRRERPGTAGHVRALIESTAPEAIADAVRAMMGRQDATPLLAAIRCPTLVLVGNEDEITPPAVAERMNRAIAGSRLVVVPGAGHLASLEQPELFNAALAQFLGHQV